ncbi:MAG: peptidyl-prolyl cis-trans isomerase [Pseudomonadota bacterium]
MARKKGKTFQTLFLSVFGFFIVIAFALPQTGISNFARNEALKVGSAGFTASEIREELNRAISQRRFENDGKYSYADAQADGLLDQTIQQMTARSAIRHEANALGLAMPRDLVRDILNSDERFQDPSTGKFNAQVLAAILSTNNLTVQGFEEIISEEALRSQLLAAAGRGAGAPKTITDAVLLRESETRSLNYVVVDDTIAAPAVAPTDDDLQSFYTNNPDPFTAPEFRTLTYVTVRNADFEDSDAVTDERLQEIYDTNRERLYETPATRSIFQVRFDGETEAAAAVAELRSGTSFEDIVERRGLTMDAVTFEDVRQSDLVDPNVGLAAFSPELAAGDVSEPIEGLFPGFVVVQVNELTPASTTPFDEVKDDIRTALLKSETQKLVYEAIEALEDSRDTGAALLEAASNAGVEAKTVGPLDRFSFGPGGEIIPDVPGEVLQEAFALDEGTESEALEFEDESGYFLVALDEVTPAALKPFDTVSEEVKRLWEADDRRARVQVAVDKLKAAALETSLSQAAEEAGATLETLEVSRRSPEASAFSEILLGSIFLADVGETIDGPAADLNATAIVTINEAKHTPSPDAIAQAVSLEQLLSFQLDQEIFDAYITSVQADLGVQTDTEAINQIIAEGG